MARPLTARQQRFVEEYLHDLNATQAYIRAGYRAEHADVAGPRLLGNVGVSEAIAAAKAARSERTQVHADAIVRQLWAIANADPRELSEYRRTCCRYCYGQGYLYQRTPNERARALAKWEAAQTKNSTNVFDELGGVGFNATRDPHPDCPECFGEGVAREYFHDTRKLSPAAQLLFEGVEVTRDGLKFNMSRREHARELLAKHLGMFDEKNRNADLGDDVRAAKIKAELDAMDSATAAAA